MFGATETIFPYGVDYLGIILLGTPFFLFAMATNAVVRGEGNARVAMGTMIISGLLNIALDPLFIYGFGMAGRGHPQRGGDRGVPRAINRRTR